MARAMRHRGGRRRADSTDEPADAPQPPRQRADSWPGLSEEPEPLRKQKTKPRFSHDEREWQRRLANYVLLGLLLGCAAIAAFGAQHGQAPYDRWPVLGGGIAAVALAFVAFSLSVPAVTRTMWLGYDDLDENQLHKGRWVNTAGSLLHAAVCGVMSSAAFYRWWATAPANDTLLSTPDGLLPYATVAFSLGYFVYDTWDFIRTGLYVDEFGIILHHITIWIVCGLGMLLDIGVMYLVASLLCELNSTFLHVRTLMFTAGYTLRDRSYQVAWALLWLTMITSRVGVHGGLIPMHVSQYGEWDSKTLFFIGGFCLMVFNILNVTLLYDLVLKFRRERWEAQQEEL